jgi:hypothetical protein
MRKRGRKMRSRPIIVEIVCYGYHQFELFGSIEYPTTKTREGWKLIKDDGCLFNPRPGHVWLCPLCAKRYEREEEEKEK